MALSDRQTDMEENIYRHLKPGGEKKNRYYIVVQHKKGEESQTEFSFNLSNKNTRQEASSQCAWLMKKLKQKGDKNSKCTHFS